MAQSTQMRAPLVFSNHTNSNSQRHTEEEQITFAKQREEEKRARKLERRAEYNNRKK